MAKLPTKVKLALLAGAKSEDMTLKGWHLIVLHLLMHIYFAFNYHLVFSAQDATAWSIFTLVTMSGMCYVHA
jgi:hypothetical protein